MTEHEPSGEWERLYREEQQNRIVASQEACKALTEITRLKADLAKAIRALEFYANEKHFTGEDIERRGYRYMHPHSGDIEYIEDGKLARAVLAELRGENE